MNDVAFVSDWLDHFRGVMEPEGLAEKLAQARERIADARTADGKLIFAGNGASASIASHYALDYTKQGKVRSVCFNDAALLTAYANDYGYEQWVARAIEHHARPGDLAVLISTSGTSRNIVNAAQYCRDHEIDVIGFSGHAADNPLSQLSTTSFWVDSRAYNVVEAVHGMWLGALCDLLIGLREYGVKG